MFVPIANKIVLFLFNSSKYTQGTIRHELTHYFQHYFNYGLTKINFDKCFDYSKLDHLFLNKSEIKYLFSAKEYLPHIENFIYVINKLKNPDKFLHECLNYFENHKFDKEILTCGFVQELLNVGIDLINIKFVLAILIIGRKTKTIIL